jgi:hypothetical protein
LQLGFEIAVKAWAFFRVCTSNWYSSIGGKM